MPDRGPIRLVDHLAGDQSGEALTHVAHVRCTGRQQLVVETGKRVGQRGGGLADRGRRFRSGGEARAPLGDQGRVRGHQGLRVEDARLHGAGLTAGSRRVPPAAPRQRPRAHRDRARASGPTHPLLGRRRRFADARWTRWRSRGGPISTSCMSGIQLLAEPTGDQRAEVGERRHFILAVHGQADTRAFRRAQRQDAQDALGVHGGAGPIEVLQAYARARQGGSANEGCRRPRVQARRIAGSPSSATAPGSPPGGTASGDHRWQMPPRTTTSAAFIAGQRHRVAAVQVASAAAGGPCSNRRRGDDAGGPGPDREGRRQRAGSKAAALDDIAACSRARGTTVRAPPARRQGRHRLASVAPACSRTADAG